MNIDNLIKKFEGAKMTGHNSYMCKCPAHQDKKPSLSITEADDKILMNCFAGCDIKDILLAVGLSEKDLFNKNNEAPKIVKEYYYLDEVGKVLYKSTRYEPKRFVQAQYKNNNWEYNMKDVKKYVLYNLPNVLKEDEIYFVEGEKDSENLSNLGYTATTTIGGASSYVKRADMYSKYLKGKMVYIIPDNDKSGYKYAEDIKKSLNGIAKDVKILKLIDEVRDLKEKGDISDVIEKFGIVETRNIIENLKKQTSEDKDFPIKNLEELNEEKFSEILHYLEITIKYNVITRRLEITGLPSVYAREDYGSILPIYLKMVLRNNSIKIRNKKILEELIELEIAKNNYNPILELLNANKWDGNDRLPKIYEIFGVTKELDRIKILKWLQQCIAMLLNNYEKPFGAEGVLTLFGRQGIGKTRIFSLLALNPEWIAEGVIIDMNNKDTKILATSRWICELGEVDDTLKKEQSSLKAFVTSTNDDIRHPYAKTSTRRLRNTSFCATVNSHDFLKDQTGCRRFWIIEVKEIKHYELEKLGNEWILQLWLQIYEEVKKDINCFRLTSKETKDIIFENIKYTELLPYEEELMDLIIPNSENKECWTNKRLINEIFHSGNPVLLGKAISKIASNFPNSVTVKRGNKGVQYYMELKKNK